MVQRSVYLYGDWESYDSDTLLRLLRPEWVVFDIGSYFGYYALLASRRCAKVFAFEPYPPSYALLSENKRLNGFENLTTLSMAITDRNGVESFRTPPAFNQGSGGLTTPRDGGVQVPTTSLDAFVRGAQLDRVDLVKIDVEGSEVFALMGARETIQRFRPVLMIEVDPGKLAMLGQRPEGLLAVIDDLGYVGYRATRVGLLPFNPTSDIDGFVNVFCFPREVDIKPVLGRRG
jgi:FkbM family methyltransferase